MIDHDTSISEDVVEYDVKLDSDYNAPLTSFGDNESKNTAGADVTTNYALNPELLEPEIKKKFDERFKSDKYFRKDVESIRMRKSELLYSESSII